MTVYYNPKSRTLKRLRLEQKIEVKEILSNTAALKTRKVDLKYRVNHGGQTLPIYSFQYGKGEERGKERILYTHIDNKFVVLDHVTEHDYQKVTTMDRSFMRNWFADFKGGICEIVEIGEADPNTPQVMSIEEDETDIDAWVPAMLDSAGHLLQPSCQQKIVAFGQKRYPLILEGVAGSGKTLVLSLTCHYLSQQQSDQDQYSPQNARLYYVYPNGATLLGEKMSKEWFETGLVSSESWNQWDFSLAAVDEILPEGLKSNSMRQLQETFVKLFELKKKQLSKSVSKKHIKPSALEISWERLIGSGLPPVIVFDYLITLLVFRSYPDLQLAHLRDLISARGGFTASIFDDIEQIYSEIVRRANWQEVQQAFHQTPLHFDMLLIDEAQNISFIALAYLLHHTPAGRVICSGDRNQATSWESISSLELFEIFVSRRRLPYQKELFVRHYRCPQDIWLYAKSRILRIKEQLFGKELSQKATADSSDSLDAGSAIERVEIKNAHYIKISEKKRLIIEAFFEKIPEMTTDCFIITDNIHSFEAFSQQYLSGKKFITLTPQQAAGLEVKTVIALNPLNWSQISKLEATKTQKVRSKNLSASEQDLYEQLNHFYVTVTRSSQNLLILESQSTIATPLQQQTYEGLHALPHIEEHLYANSTPEALFDIFMRMGGQSTAEGRDFFARYGDYFQSVIEKAQQVAPVQPIIARKKSPEPERMQTIGDIISHLTSPRIHFENLSQLSESFLARFLFEPYGKKKKQSLWDRLIEQLGGETQYQTTEIIVWSKLLRSQAVTEFLSMDFYRMSIPGGTMAISEWLLVSHSDNFAHNQLKKNLVEKSLKNSTFFSKGVRSQCISPLLLDCNLPESAPPTSSPLVASPDTESPEYSLGKGTEMLFSQRLPVGSAIVTKPSFLKDGELSIEVPLDDKKQSRAIIRNFVDAIIHEPVSGDTPNPFSVTFRKALDDFQKDYDPHGVVSVTERKKKIEKIIKTFCVIQARFWISLTYVKYLALQKITDNPSLFIEFREKAISTNGAAQPSDMLLFDESLLQKAFDLIVRAHQEQKISLTEMRDATTNIIQLLSLYSKNLPTQYALFKAPGLVLLYRLIHKKNIFQRSSAVLKEMFFDDNYWDDPTTKRNQDTMRMFANEATTHGYAPLFCKFLDVQSLQSDYSIFEKAARRYN